MAMIRRRQQPTPTRSSSYGGNHNNNHNGIWSRRRRRNNNRGGCNDEPVGTQAVALQNLERNSKLFNYPSPGFVTPMEYTLLYSILSEPKLYPENVASNAIQQEDYDPYLIVKTEENDKPCTNKSHNSNDEKKNEKEDSSTVTAPHDAPKDETESSTTDVTTSYAQLTALLYLCSEQWPPESQVEEISVPHLLCKCLLQCVVRHARLHDLDRETEVKSLLEPLQDMARRRGNHACLAYIVPVYVGMAASIVTANPLPMVVGSYLTNAMGFRAIYKLRGEEQKVRKLQAETNRAADIEKASLLEEAEQDEY